MRPIGPPKVCRSPAYSRRHVEARLDAADRERGDGDPAVVEGGEELRVAAAALAEQVGLGHPHVVEAQRVGVGGVPAELVVRRLGDEAGRAAGHDDREISAAAVVALPGAGGDGDQRGDVGAGVGDELLGAVDDPLAADELGLGLRRAASEPAPGSVRPKPASCSPATRSGSQVSCCSSVP